MATLFRPSLLQSSLRQALCGLVFGLSLSVATPVLADNVPDVQRLMKQGQYNQALEKVDAYLAGKPKDAQGRFLKGLILTEMNKPHDAIAVFTKLTEDYPELPEPYNNLAVLYAQQKQYDRARSALEMAIRTHPSYAIAYENLGDIYAKLASQSYDKALQLDSTNTAAQSKISLIRELISTSAKPGSRAGAKPAAASSAATTPATTPATAPAAAPAKAPTAAVVATTAGAAAAKTVEPKAAEPTAAPAAAPVVATAPGEGAKDDVLKAVNAWAAAWSEKDVAAYLAFYGPDFVPPKGQNRNAWEAEREARVSKPGPISVAVDAPEVALDGDKATVKFRQHYKSANLKTSTNKTLVLVNNGGKWQIQQEISR